MCHARECAACYAATPAARTHVDTHARTRAHRFFPCAEHDAPPPGSSVDADAAASLRQGSAAWHAARKRHITGSALADLLGFSCAEPNRALVRQQVYHRCAAVPRAACRVPRAACACAAARGAVAWRVPGVLTARAGRHCDHSAAPRTPPHTQGAEQARGLSQAAACHRRPARRPWRWSWRAAGSGSSSRGSRSGRRAANGAVWPAGVQLGPAVSVCVCVCVRACVRVCVCV
jgi:hypothetical protein